MIVDAHFHCWRLARADYGWLTPALVPIYRDVSIDDWAREAQPLGVRGGVLVQAAPTAAETMYLLETAATHDAVLGVVGWIDLLAADAPERITLLVREQPKLKGLRPMLQDIADPDWILQPALSAALVAMANQRLVFDALVKPIHLPRMTRLCERHPDLQVVIDHGAKPDIARDQWEPWASQIALVARQTQAVCKLSGLLTEAGATSMRGAARRWMAHLLDSFGPQRLLWGSDWPVLELASNYQSWWGDVQDVLSALSESERAAVLGGNARRIYGL